MWDEPYEMDPGATEPVIVADDQELLLAYRVGARGMDRVRENGLHFDSNDDVWGIIRFSGYLKMQFGHPNDEVLGGHPLYARGLKPYTFHFVENSPWFEEVKRQNSVHDRHSNSWAKDTKHYIITFHDDTLEVLADSANLLDPIAAANGKQAILKVAQVEHI
jgi:hypothetical protein